MVFDFSDVSHWWAILCPRDGWHFGHLFVTTTERGQPVSRGQDAANPPTSAQNGPNRDDPAPNDKATNTKKP